MLESVKNGIEAAKVDGIREMLGDGRYDKRSLLALAGAIGDSEDTTGALISAHFPTAVRTTGRVSGKVFYSLNG